MQSSFFFLWHNVMWSNMWSNNDRGRVKSQFWHQGSAFYYKRTAKGSAMHWIQFGLGLWGTQCKNMIMSARCPRIGRKWSIYNGIRMTRRWNDRGSTRARVERVSRNCDAMMTSKNRGCRSLEHFTLIMLSVWLESIKFWSHIFHLYDVFSTPTET